ncbi:unnamed protein product [Cuscuta campestris]|uniref:Uncharacterized protein n=1 Tax=Cuscuta campestris TaxID=132261 RepID=A0A484MAN8_9ASTE|nr:unnamed protein product [Cuscuta campestris]
MDAYVASFVAPPVSRHATAAAAPARRPVMDKNGVKPVVSPPARHVDRRATAATEAAVIEPPPQPYYSSSGRNNNNNKKATSKSPPPPGKGNNNNNGRGCIVVEGGGDKNIDVKATSYILKVKERLRREEMKIMNEKK